MYDATPSELPLVRARPGPLSGVGEALGDRSGVATVDETATQPAASRLAGARPHEYVIEGITHGGKPFRPSDWAERLAGALSSFRPPGLYPGAHIGYSPYCAPRIVAGAKCVIVSDALRGIEPMAWDFVISFARDNELRMHTRRAGEGD